MTVRTITEDSKDDIYLLAYGSLRKGQYNYNSIVRKLGNVADDIKFIKKTSVAGLKMYDLGLYPMCIYTGSRKDVITCDILKLSKEIFNIIHTMEIESGYTRYVLPINTKHDYTRLYAHMNIYLFKNNVTEVESSHLSQVTTGDWIKHQEKTTV